MDLGWGAWGTRYDTWVANNTTELGKRRIEKAQSEYGFSLLLCSARCVVIVEIEIPKIASCYCIGPICQTMSLQHRDSQPAEMLQWRVFVDYPRKLGAYTSKLPFDPFPCIDIPVPLRSHTEPILHTASNEYMAMSCALDFASKKSQTIFGLRRPPTMKLHSSDPHPFSFSFFLVCFGKSPR